jgi:tripeptide aminopeptidase
MRHMALLTAGLAAFASLALGSQAPPAAPAAGDLVASAAFKRASTFIASDYDRFVNELVALTEIPAPPFKEERRAAAYLDMLRGLGLRDVEQDARGNVMGVRPGRGGGGMLAVAAHLDTVFPEGTDVRVRRAGTRLMAPGIGDNTRGLALLLAVVRALDAGGFETPVDLLFVGNVGEEGEGDLRGVKYLLRDGKYRNRITAFLAIDGGEQGTITRAGVGSRRYRVTFRGPGGHSYGAFGLVNPAYAMAAAIASLAETRVPASPKTTFNVGALRGGTSVNSIPSGVSMDVDLRSESCAELRRLDAQFLAVVEEAVRDENRQRSTREGPVAAEPVLIGDRPCGETPVDAPIVEAASAAVRAFGLRPAYAVSSTDSNIPMSMGIPALTIGRGGTGGRAHAPDEWTDVEPDGARRAVEVALAIVLMVARAG